MQTPIDPSLAKGALYPVRDAEAVDIAEIRRIYAHHVANGLASFEEVPPEEAEMGARFAAVRGAGLPYLVASGVDGCVLGYSYASTYRPRSAYRYTVENSVYIRPDIVGRGIGRQLLSALIARCEAGPWRQMVAVIGDSENKASIGLHRALGFRHTGTLEGVGFKFGRWVDSVIMQRSLSGGVASQPFDDSRPS